MRYEAEGLADSLKHRAAVGWGCLYSVRGKLNHGDVLLSAGLAGPDVEGIIRSAMTVQNSSESPEIISETPNMDLLSDVLQNLRLRGRIFKQGDYCGNWALDAAGARGTIFHLIGRGQAWVHREGEPEPMIVRGGDLVLFPRPRWHQLSGTPQRQPGMCAGSSNEGPFTTVLCARVDFKTGESNAILDALPEVIVVRSEDHGTSAELHALARLMLVEYEATAPGRQGVLDRLAEAMFVLVLRHHMAQAPKSRNFLGALRDENIARALGAIHRAPGEVWRVDALAREARMSRTMFAYRFAELLGNTPMQYLTAWRMHLADEMLADRRLSVAEIASRLGYQTETAFRRAFRRVRGLGPGSVRRLARATGN